MNSSIRFYAVAFSLCVNFGVNAEEPPVLDKDSFVGSWKMSASRRHLEVNRDEKNKKLKETPFKYLAGNDEKKNNEVWVFKADGRFELIFDDPRAASGMTSKTTYRVEGDTLKIAKPGRPGKYSNYKVHSKDDKNMILKSGVYYFFSKQ